MTEDSALGRDVTGRAGSDPLQLPTERPSISDRLPRDSGGGIAAGLAFAGDFGPSLITLDPAGGEAEGQSMPGQQRRSSDPSSSTEAKARRRLCLVQAERSCFELLALVPSCATDHMPDSYFQVGGIALVSKVRLFSPLLLQALSMLAFGQGK